MTENINFKVISTGLRTLYEGDKLSLFEAAILQMKMDPFVEAVADNAGQAVLEKTASGVSMEVYIVRNI